MYKSTLFFFNPSEQDLLPWDSATLGFILEVVHRSSVRTVLLNEFFLPRQESAIPSVSPPLNVPRRSRKLVVV